MKNINRKSLLKRVKVTKKGKVLRRISGASHFRSKKTRIALNQKKKTKSTDKKILKYLK